MPARKLGSYLGDSSRLQALTRQVRHLAAIERAWKEIAPAPLAAAASVGALQQQTLVIFATNGAVAAKLRQLLPSLLGKIQKRGFEVTAIRIEVQAAPRRAREPRTKTAALSPRALKNLSELEQKLQDSPLKNALQRLLRRHGGSTDDQPPHDHQSAEHQQKNEGKPE